MTYKRKTVRPYRRIDKLTIAKHHAAVAATGSGSAAVRTMTPGYSNEGDRAYHIQKKAEAMPTDEYMQNSIEQIAAEAVQVLGELVHSADEAIATRNVHYAIDQQRGRSVQRTENKNVNISIETVLK